MVKNKNTRRGLGRGLSALMAEVDLDQPNDTPETPPVAPRSAEMVVPIEKLRPNRNQPRQDFDERDLDDLTASIREKGIIQPLIVRVDPESPNDFQIVAGERRWRAAQRANLHDIPIIVRQLDDIELLEIGIIENIQRADLNSVEEALGYRQLMDKFGRTQEQMSSALGKSRSYIANILRLLNLPDDVLISLREGKLSAGHARALVTSDNASELARQIINKGLSVRQTEALVKKRPSTEKKPRKINSVKDADTKALEQDLGANLGMKVLIDHKDGTETGNITLSYDSLDDLDLLCQLLSATR